MMVANCGASIVRQAASAQEEGISVQAKSFRLRRKASWLERKSGSVQEKRVPIDERAIRFMRISSPFARSVDALQERHDCLDAAKLEMKQREVDLARRPVLYYGDRRRLAV